jgi:hypothetical protein
MALINKSQQVSSHQILSLNIKLRIHTICKRNELFKVFYLHFVAAEKTVNPAVDADDQHQLLKEVNPVCSTNGNSNSSGKEEKSNPEESDLPERYEI